VNVYATDGTPFAAAVTDEKGTKLIEVNTSKLFVDTAAAVLDFLETGKPNIDRAESLVIRTHSRRSRQAGGAKTVHFAGVIRSTFPVAGG
jgi:hypothetical protein